MPRATIDFECRSACSIKKCGSWRYSLDPTTEVLCLAYRLPHWQPERVEIWHPTLPVIGIEESTDWKAFGEFVDWIQDGELVEAHNAWFERGIWRNILEPRFGFPRVSDTAWRCSAAKAAAYALPRNLEKAAEALHLSVAKDMEGSKVMKKMMRPRKPRKKEIAQWKATHGDAPLPLLYFEDVDLFCRLCVYCEQDVRTEEAVSEALDDLDSRETAVYLLDQQINERGFRCDPQAVSTALTIIADQTDQLNAELCALTGGSPSKATQRTKMVEWFESKGVVLPNTQKGTIQEALDADDEPEFDDIDYDVDTDGDPFADPDEGGDGLPPDVRRALEILQTLSLSSTAKFEKMRLWLCPDERVHGGLLYHGASTGRWSGAGVQPHNFPKGFLKNKDYPMGQLWDDLFTLTRWEFELKYKHGLLKMLSHMLRGAITATPGRVLYVADFASIELRVLLWLAEDDEHLAMIRGGMDMYLDLASKIYARPLDKDNNPKERGLGKVGVLGLGYQMGFRKFVDSAKTMAGIVIEEEFSRTVVDTYREEYWRVVQMWYAMEEAAIAAVQEPGTPFTCGPIIWIVEDPRFLFAYLPSGRRLAYPEPEIQERLTPWGAKKDALTYMGVNQYSRKWQRSPSYGGLLVENVTQAVARDLMADAMLRCAASGVYDPILSVHDEAICEADEGKGSVHEFEALIAETPEWAEGCPVGAEGFSAFRYHK